MLSRLVASQHCVISTALRYASMLSALCSMLSALCFPLDQHRYRKQYRPDDKQVGQQLRQRMLRFDVNHLLHGTPQPKQGHTDKEEMAERCGW